MYAKVFAQIYDGTLCTKGPWEALVTFQQFLVLADPDGQVDMTAEAIARRTTIPLGIIEKGIAALLKPDLKSRTPTEDGRRLVPLSEGRDWGWLVVNYKHYRELKREEERRQYHKDYWHKRKLNKTQQPQQPQPDSTASTESTETVDSRQRQETEALASGEGPADAGLILSSEIQPPEKPFTTVKNANRELRENAKDVLGYLNRMAGKGFHEVDANLDPIIARLKEDATVLQAKEVVLDRVRDWASKPDMQDFLRPETLFRKSKFWSYLGNITAPPPEKKFLDTESPSGAESTSTGGENGT